MANLSNINNILRTGSLGVGINRDPLGAFEISSATKPGIKMFNTAASGKTYEAYSDTNGNYIIYDQDADDNRFVINSSGNSTFAGNVSTGNLTVTNTTSGWTAYINNNIGSGTQSGLLLDAGSSSADFAMYVRNAAGSSDFFAIKGNGNLGIGTASPDSPLHLSQAAANTFFKMEAYASTQGADAGINVAREQVTGSESNLSFWTNTGSALTQKMAIDSSGDVTIQTSGADDIKNFTINSSNGSSQVAGLIIQNDGANGYIHFKAGAGNATPTTKLTIGNAANSGKVGIGTDTPTELLHLQSVGPARLLIEADTNNVTETDNAQIILKQDGSLVIGRLGYQTNTNDLEVWNEFSESVIFGTSDTERIRITSAGGISFGSTGTAYGTSGQVLTSNGNAAPSWQAAGGSSPWTTSGNDIYNNNSGNIGIGITNPSFGLVAARNALAGTVNDGVMFGMETTTNAGNAGYRFKSGSEYYQVLYNGSSIQWKNYDAAYNTKMTLTNDGNLGIQNSNPSAHYYADTLVVGSGVNTGSYGSADVGITIFTGSSVFPYTDYARLAFTDSTGPGNGFMFEYLNRDNSSWSDSEPSLVLKNDNNKVMGISNQTNSTSVPRIVLEPNYFNSSLTQGNLDHAVITIPLRGGLNNPGVHIYGDSQGNSNPFVGFTSTSSSSQITSKFIRFYHNTTLCGTIQKRYNANEVQYLTTSDYRLKEDLKPFKALDTICKINVYNYKWKDIEGYNVNYGVLAHELQELIPEVVAGEKDEVNKKGEEEYQSVDYSKLVPHLIQSIQELKAEIDELKKK